MDLLDWLDAWFFVRGVAVCSAMRRVILHDRGFPYDFARPRAVCP